jgi:hypothetical protein
MKYDNHGVYGGAVQTNDRRGAAATIACFIPYDFFAAAPAIADLWRCFPMLRSSIN